jgi:uncharacterized OsmC-like protein
VGRGYGASFEYGIDEKVGGLSDRPNPGDLLCAALAACEDGTIRMVAGLLGVERRDWRWRSRETSTFAEPWESTRR